VSGSRRLSAADGWLMWAGAQHGKKCHILAAPVRYNLIMAASHLWYTAGLATLVWLLALWAGAWATRWFRDVRAEGPRLDVGGESPAVASLLANRLRVDRVTLPATVLDLAARGWYHFDEGGPDRILCRQVRRQVHAVDRLAPYERRVLDHVSGRMGPDGVAPASALLEDAATWWDAFEGEVRAEARRLGLTRDRWPRGARSLYRLAALGPGGLVAVAVLQGSHSRLAAAAYGCLGWGVLAFGFSSVLQGEQKTPAGRAAAAHWRGVRAALRSDAAFTTLSPAAIAIWGRRLAYGSVFGAAPAAITALSPPPKDRAWSSYGGRWRLVRIGSHSQRIPPVLSLYLAVLFGLVGLFFLFMVVPLGLSGHHDGGLALAAVFVPLVIVLISAAAAVSLGRSFLKGVTGPSQVEVVGQVIKRWVESVPRDDRNVEYPCVAVDDGRAADARAWVLPWPAYGAVQVGSIVRVRADPRRNTFLGLEVLERPREPESRRGAAGGGQGPAEDRLPRSLEVTRLITADEAAAALGEPVGPPSSIAVGASTTSCLWRPTSGRRSSLTVTVATGFWANRALRAARRRGQPVVADTGDEAFLLADRTCVVRCGSRIMKLILRDTPGPDPARILVRLAGLAAGRVEGLAAEQPATGPITASEGGS
jgi:Predicted membrane protein (DUF2207)